MNNTNKISANRISAARHERNLSQSQLAQLLSEVSLRETPLTLAAISAWECGRRMPSMEMYEALEKVLGVKKEYLQGISDSKDGITHEKADESPEITLGMLPDYDKKPVFVEFNNVTHEDQWGIYDNNRKVIVFIKGVLSIQSPAIKRILCKEEHYFKENKIYAKKPMSLIKMKSYKLPVYVEMKTNDPYIQGQYNGWYRHNENNTALVNSIGLALPYEGIGISYEAYGSAATQ